MPDYFAHVLRALRECSHWVAVVVALVVLPSAAGANADKRVALVIGNGDYKAAVKLDNPVYDAKAVADQLKKLGFQVIEGYDEDVNEMRISVGAFAAALPESKAAIVYYAGHGVSVDEENYLLPTDIALKSPADLDLGAISVSLILKQMKRDERVNVVILDACRNNPFADALAHSRTRSLVAERGLSKVDGDLARGTLIAFASDPKSTALDGPPGEHSPFSKALIEHLADPGVPIDTVMSRVRSEVWETTQNRRLPWVNTSIIGEFSLNPAPAPAVVANAAAEAPAAGAADSGKQAQEDLMWESAQRSNLAGDYQAYLDAYPNGVFAAMARNRIASLTAAPDTSVGRTPQAPNGAPSSADLKGEVGTMTTEQSLNLTLADRKEVQQRLAALNFAPDPATGVFGDKTRAAIAQWQKRHEVTATSWLGPIQLAVLKTESEDAYRRFLAARPAAPARAATQARKTPQPADQQAQRHRQPPPQQQAQPQPAQPQQSDNGASSAATGAFLGGVATGLMMQRLHY
ncbi:MAG TPA: caspase family protein [Roseiarcus sp.]|nr:caspase family protein [Roseiarcus sp.]